MAQATPPPDDFDQRRFLFREMTRQDWDQLFEDLWDYCERQIRAQSWRIAAPSCRHIASRTVERVLENPYLWDPSKREHRHHPLLCLKKFLFDISLSLIRKEWSRHSHLKHVDPTTPDGGDILDTFVSRGRSPEEELEISEDWETIQRIERFCDERGYGDEFRLYFYEEMKPRQVAAKLGYDVKRAYSRVAQMKELIRRHFGTQDDDEGGGSDIPAVVS